jgi:hypothetical protein
MLLMTEQHIKKKKDPIIIYFMPFFYLYVSKVKVLDINRNEVHYEIWGRLKFGTSFIFYFQNCYNPLYFKKFWKLGYKSRTT